MNNKFEVPYNGDKKIIDLYKVYKDNIGMIYGRADDKYPNGRNTKTRKPITLDDITTVVEEVRGENISFNYVLNGNYHNNKEYSQEYRKKFTNHVKDLHKRGVDIVTLGNIFLIEMIKQEVPDMKIFASVTLEVDCLRRLKQLEQIGVDYYCPSKTILKN